MGLPHIAVCAAISLSGLWPSSCSKAPAPSQRAKAAELKSAVETWQIISLTSLAVGGAAAISAIELFIVGEPPDKYGAFHAGLAVTPGLTAFSLTGRF